MHHVVLERWSRGCTWLHRRDPRAKIVVLAAFLIALATTPSGSALSFLLYFALPATAILAAEVPLGKALVRSGLVLPFAAVFALFAWSAGQTDRAAMLLVKSYLSALGVLATVSVTPLPGLLRGLERMGVPRFLLMVAQFLYRYLFVVSEEAQHMAAAAVSRGSASRVVMFRFAAGAVAVLFARSYARAEQIHRAMLARGFEGRFLLPADLRADSADYVFAIAASSASALIRFSA